MTVAVLLIVTGIGMIGWGLYLGDRAYTKQLEGLIGRTNSQTDRLFDAVDRLIAELPRAMSPWLKASEGAATFKRPETAERRTAYLASPEAKEALRQRLKEQYPQLTDTDLDNTIGEINAQVMGVKIGI